MPRIAAVALALALPAAAPAFEWGAHAGLDYFREDRWTDGGGHTVLPRLQLDLGMSGSGFLLSPTTATYLASVQWHRLSESNGSLDTSRAFLLYQLRAALFQDPRSPLSLRLQASRMDEDFRQDGTAGSSRANTTSAGADLRLYLPDRPYLNLGYHYLDRQETGPLLAGADRTVQTVTASTGHGTPTYSYAARYTGRFSTGTYDADNYDDHRVDLDAQTALTADVLARLTESYYRRIPDNRAATNLAQELNAVSTLVSTAGSLQGQQQLGYAYTHALSSAPATQDVERAEQRLTYSTHRLFLGTPWQLRGLADVSISEIRSGATVDRAAGQFASLLGIWRRVADQDLLELRAGPKLGVREPLPGPAELGYGAQAGATAQRRWGELTGSASYDLGYDSDLFAVAGWNLRQDALLSLRSPLGVGQAAAQLQASAQRRGGGILGGGATRSLSALASYAWRRNTLTATAGMASGVTASLGEPLRGDGLFIPAPYDTHSRYASLAATAMLSDRLWASARARYSSVSMPDRPDLDEAELMADVSWGYAGIFLGLEDRFLVSSVGGATVRDNRFLFRIRRAFGSAR